jgi:hypothetical protein
MNCPYQEDKDKRGGIEIGLPHFSVNLYFKHLPQDRFLIFLKIYMMAKALW